MKSESVYNPHKQTELQDENSDVRKLFLDVLKIWPFMLIFIVINLCIAYVLVKKSNPTYQVKATLEMKR